MRTISNVFSREQLDELLQHPHTVAAKPQQDGKVSFTVPLTDSIRATLETHLNINLSRTSELPMRWIKGDTPPHVDAGASAFQHTYLVYLNGSEGEFILDQTSHLMTANTAFIFSEGVSHRAQNTGAEPRLLVGPMNEHIEPVGATIAYYDNYADALAQNGNYIANQGNNWILGGGTNDLGTSSIYGSIGSYTTWRIAVIGNNITPLPTGVYSNGFDLMTINPQLYNYNTFSVYPSAPCFLEGTKILCLINGKSEYHPIETLTPGTLVKTSGNGYKKVHSIGKGHIQNPGNDERSENRLYRCSPESYPGLTDNLYITGCHSILVDALTDVQREMTKKHLGRIYMTEQKYRLMAYLDDRALPYHGEGTIWHLALENADEQMNYGIYANGLLVETCSIRFLKNYSNMTLQ